MPGRQNTLRRQACTHDITTASHSGEELNRISPAIDGVRAMPAVGSRTPAARGMPTRLYPNAHHRFCCILRKVALLRCNASSTCNNTHHEGHNSRALITRGLSSIHTRGSNILESQLLSNGGQMLNCGASGSAPVAPGPRVGRCWLPPPLHLLRHPSLSPHPPAATLQAH